MGADDKGKGITETIADEAKRARDAYSHGDTSGAPGPLVLVKLVLRPFELLPVTVERLMYVVRRALGGVPPDRIVAPSATIAAPAALQYALLADDLEVIELQEMLVNLLVSSMDRDTAASVHPAFVSMISQLTQHEAWILKSIDRDEYALVNVYELGPGGGRGRLLEARTHLGLGIGIDEARLHQYISNLDRPGILRFSALSSSDIDGHSRLVNAIAMEWTNRGAISSSESIVLTALGRQFLDACVRPRAR